MADLNLSDFFLTEMTTYGSVVLSIALLLGALGVPVPATLLVVAAGTLVQQGVIDWTAALGFGLLGAVLGDNVSYALGHYAKGWVQRHFGWSSAWQTARTKFEQHGALAVYLTRFLLTPLALPTNFIAGGSGFTFRRFLAFDVVGELTWLLLYGGLGYAFGSQVELINQAVSEYSVWWVVVVAVVIGIYGLISYRKLIKRPYDVCRLAL